MKNYEFRNPYKNPSKLLLSNESSENLDIGLNKELQKPQILPNSDEFEKPE